MKKLFLFLGLFTSSYCPPPIKPPFELQAQAVRYVLIPANRYKLRALRHTLNGISHQILATVRNTAGESEIVKQERLERLMLQYGKLMRRHRL